MWDEATKRDFLVWAALVVELMVKLNALYPFEQVVNRILDHFLDHDTQPTPDPEKHDNDAETRDNN